MKTELPSVQLVSFASYSFITHLWEEHSFTLSILSHYTDGRQQPDPLLGLREQFNFLLLKIFTPCRLLDETFKTCKTMNTVIPKTSLEMERAIALIHAPQTIL